MGLFRNLATTGNIQTRAIDESNGKWLLENGGQSTRTGIAISEENAITNAPIWNAIFQLSSIVGSLPLHLLKEIPEGQEIDKAHNLYNLMHLKPNNEMSSMVMREALVGQMITWGAAYAQVERDGNDKVKAIWPLQSKYMQIVRIKADRTEDSLWYRYTPGHSPNVAIESGVNQSMFVFPRRSILHIPYFSRNGISHYRPIRQTKESIGLTMALEDYAASYFRNNAKPAAVIEIPGGLNKEAMDNFRESWNEQTEGLDNAHRTAVLEEGIKLHEYGSTPKNSQSIEQREFQLDEVARIFNIPPHLIKNLKRSTYSNIEQQSQDFVRYTLMQILVRMEENYTIQLLPESDMGKRFFKHNVDGLLRADTEARWESYSKGFNMGVYNPNDIRKLEDMNTYPEGNDYYIQLNMQKVEDVGKENELMLEGMKKDMEDDDSITDNDPDDNQDKKSEKAFIPTIEKRQQDTLVKVLVALRNQHHDSLLDAAQRYVAKDVKMIRAAAKKHFIDADPLRSERSITGFNEWLEDIYTSTMTAHLRKTVFPTLKLFLNAVQFNVAQTLGGDILIDDQIRSFTESYLRDFVFRIINKSVLELKKLISDAAQEDLGNIGDRIIVRSEEWAERKSGKIARREIIRGSNAMSRAKYISMGFIRFKWRTIGENCPFCNFLSGKTVGIEQNFMEAGEKLSGEVTLKDGQKKTRFLTTRSKVKHAPLHDGCDCQVVPDIG